MPKVKLRIEIEPQLVGPAALAYAAQHPVTRFLHLTTPDATLLTVQEEIAHRFSRLYPNEGELHIIKLQDSSGCDLDPDFVVEDVFSPNDQVRVIVPPPKDLHLPTTPSAPSLTLNDPEDPRGDGFFHTEDPRIPVKESRYTPGSPQIHDSHAPVHLPASAITSPVLAPPKSLHNLDIPVKRQGQATDAREAKSRRITSGMLASPSQANTDALAAPLNDTENSPRSRTPPSNGASPIETSFRSEGPSCPVSPLNKEFPQSSLRTNDVRNPSEKFLADTSDVDMIQNSKGPIETQASRAQRDSPTESKVKTGSSIEVKKTKASSQRRVHRKLEPLIREEHREAKQSTSRSETDGNSPAEEVLTKNMILELYQKKMELGEHNFEFMDENAKRVIRSLSIDMVDPMREAPRGPRRAATRACTLMKEPKRQPSKFPGNRARRSKSERAKSPSADLIGVESIVVDLEDEPSSQGKSENSRENSETIAQPNKVKAENDEASSHITDPPEENSLGPAQAVKFLNRIITEKYTSLMGESGNLLSDVAPKAAIDFDEKTTTEVSMARSDHNVDDDPKPEPSETLGKLAVNEPPTAKKETAAEVSMVRSDHKVDDDPEPEPPKTLGEVAVNEKPTAEKVLDAEIMPTVDSDVDMVPPEEMAPEKLDRAGIPDADIPDATDTVSAPAAANIIDPHNVGSDQIPTEVPTNQYSCTDLFVEEFTSSLDDSDIESVHDMALVLAQQSGEGNPTEEFLVPTQVENKSMSQGEEKHPPTWDSQRDSHEISAMKSASKAAFRIDSVGFGERNRSAKTPPRNNLPSNNTQPQDLVSDLSEHQGRSSGHNPHSGKRSMHGASTSKSLNQSKDELGSETDSDSGSEQDNAKKPRLVASTPSQATPAQYTPARQTSLQQPKSNWLSKILSADKSPGNYLKGKSSPPPDSLKPDPISASDRIGRESRLPAMTALDKLKAQGIPEVREVPTQPARVVKPTSTPSNANGSASDSESSSSESSSGEGSGGSDKDHDDKFLNIKAVAPPKKKSSSIFLKMARR